ncbi:hypothetical protein ACGF07_34615 [Kitasatospora sp. NPDC048194]|uniref:hypothetical protein n=1 Tax=Kitasatospora sp. NPDC048194 TaxID=3364045 RepID=UPI0037145DC5
MTDPSAPASYDRHGSVAEQLAYFRAVGVIGGEPTAAPPAPSAWPASGPRRRQLDLGLGANSSSTP